jgi:hypothetical protein
MSKRKYDIAVKVGEKPDGKAIWKNVGVMMEGDRGPFLLIDRTFNPAGVPPKTPGDSSIICSLFEPKTVEPKAQPKYAKNKDFDDDIPY